MEAVSSKRQIYFNLLLMLGLSLLLVRGLSVIQRGFGKSFGWTASLFTDQTVVTSVDAGSPAYLAGLRAGDRIIGFNTLGDFDKRDQRERLIKAYRAVDTEDEYTLRVLREGRPLEFRISSNYLGSLDLRFNIIQYHLIGL